MSTGHIMMAMSLDGFVARRDHTLDWLDKQPAKNEDHGFAEFLDSVDMIVMGSGSFRTLQRIGAWGYPIPGLVLSRSMTNDDIPEDIRDRVEVSVLQPQELMASLAERGINRVYVDGGAIIQSFLKAGLVQDMKITIVPILLGDGIRIFGETKGDVDLELISATPFPSGLVDLLYKIKGT